MLEQNNLVYVAVAGLIWAWSPERILRWPSFAGFSKLPSPDLMAPYTSLV